MPQFIPGLELSRRFYLEVVRPVLAGHFPGLPHAAALIGPGSDVLGLDTEMSTDHDWGPRVFIFLRDVDAGRGGEIHAALRHSLPHLFHGYPVSTEESPDEPGNHHMRLTTEGPVEHRVAITTVREFVWQHLRYDIDQQFSAADWLTFPSQVLRELTTGAVHHDGTGELTALRERFASYPRDVWLYLLACGWQHISQKDHLMPRAGYVGDELGSALIGSRLVRDVMRLCFLMERQYAPYPKWFGTAFKRLVCAPGIEPALWRAQLAPTWEEREAALGEAYICLAHMHNRLGIGDPVPATLSDFHGRPFKVADAGRFIGAILPQIADPEVAQVAARRLIGGIDQISDNTDLLDPAAWRPVLRQLYS